MIKEISLKSIIHKDLKMPKNLTKKIINFFLIRLNKDKHKGKFKKNLRKNSKKKYQKAV